MNQRYEATPKPESSTQSARILDYHLLVDAVQLSTARLLDIDGAQQAHNFNQVLEGKTPEERQRIICEVGARFDDELIKLVTVSLIAHRSERMVILADSHEGVDGTLPWQPKLEQHIEALRESGSLQKADVQVERYASSDIESLTQQAQALALETAPII